MKQLEETIENETEDIGALLKLLSSGLHPRKNKSSKNQNKNFSSEKFYEFFHILLSRGLSFLKLNFIVASLKEKTNKN